MLLRDPTSQVIVVHAVDGFLDVFGKVVDVHKLQVTVLTGKLIRFGGKGMLSEAGEHHRHAQTCFFLNDQNLVVGKQIAFRNLEHVESVTNLGTYTPGSKSYINRAAGQLGHFLNEALELTVLQTRLPPLESELPRMFN